MFTTEMKSGIDFVGGRTALPSPSLSPLSRFFSLAIASCLINIALLFLLPKQFVFISSILGIAAAGILSIPLSLSIFVIFFYYLFEGSIKILSNYHPILHISGDILIILFTLRSLLDKSSGGFAKVAATPFISLYCLFSFWVIAQFFNPLGLGFLPSLAGIKVYLVPPLLMYLSFHHLGKDQLQNFLIFIVILGCFMATIALLEYLWGQSFVLSLHPAYMRATKDGVFTGTYYRPFGTTAVPAGPGTWVTFISPIATYLLFQSKDFLSPRKRLLCIYLLFLSAPILMICQTRLAILQTATLVTLVLLFNKKLFFPRIGLVLFFIFFVGSPLLYSMSLALTKSSNLTLAQIYQIQNRARTLTGIYTYKVARESPIPRFKRAINDMQIFGMGLSRVGAASTPWQERINTHPYFRGYISGWADNLFIAIFYETGLIGLASWLLFVTLIIAHLFRSARRNTKNIGENDYHFLIWTCSSIALCIIISGLAAEGALYAPVSLFLWSSLGVGLGGVRHASQ